MSRRRSSRPNSSRGPLWLILGGLAILVVAVAAWWAGREPTVPLEVTGEPRLHVDREVVDLGDVPLGQTVQVRFELTNVGDQPLRFEREPYVEVVEGC